MPILWGSCDYQRAEKGIAVPTFIYRVMEQDGSLRTGTLVSPSLPRAVGEIILRGSPQFVEAIGVAGASSRDATGLAPDAPVLLACSGGCGRGLVILARDMNAPQAADKPAGRGVAGYHCPACRAADKPAGRPRSRG